VKKSSRRASGREIRRVLTSATVRDDQPGGSGEKGGDVDQRWIMTLCSSDFA